MITLRNIYKSFGELEVLKGIDLTFDIPGKITAILGPNGSGKTTLIKCLLGMCIPDRGDVLFRGRSAMREWNYRSQIDYLPQIARFPDNLTVRELIMWIREIRGPVTQHEELIARFGLAKDLDKRLSKLSGGTRQKVNLTLALMYNSPVLILDEPTSGLDPVAMVTLRELIDEAKASGKIILITTHIMSFVEEVADEVVFLLDGSVHFNGSLRELKFRYDEMNVERAIARMLSGRSKASQNGQATNAEHHATRMII